MRTVKNHNHFRRVFAMSDGLLRNPREMAAVSDQRAEDVARANMQFREYGTSQTLFARGKYLHPQVAPRN